MQRREFLQTAAVLAAGPWLVSRASGTQALEPAIAPARGQLPGLERVQLHNVQEITLAPDGDGWQLCRLPLALLPHLGPSGRIRPFAPAGAEIRFHLVGEEARLRLKFVDTRREVNRQLSVIAEIYHGTLSTGWVEIRDTWTDVVVKRPPAMPEIIAAAKLQPPSFPPELVRILLPLHTEIRLHSIVGDITPPAMGDTPARRYLAYGSSITHGFIATRPSDAYPARVADALGVDAVNFGFGGAAKLEPEMAEYIAGRTDWDFASLELGINLTGKSVDEFRELVAGFLPRIVERHRDKWIFCIDIFSCRHDLLGNPKLPQFRAIVRDSVQSLHAPRCVHLDGRTLLTRWSGLSTDLVHPTSAGFAEIAGGLVQTMKPAVAAGPS
jgi:lysophospholipase L1-like esterase